jgi:hypothetical protein
MICHPERSASERSDRARVEEPVLSEAEGTPIPPNRLLPRQGILRVRHTSRLLRCVGFHDAWDRGIAR